MTGCIGYTNNNDMPSNDIWYNFKSGTFQLLIASGTPNTLDTVHLNVWYGTDCNNLFPLCCYTYDFSSFPTAYIDTISGSTNIYDYIYLQFSGNAPGKFGSFGFCLKSIVENAPVCNSSPIIINSDENDQRITADIHIFPNPVNESIEIIGKTESFKKVFLTYPDGRTVWYMTYPKNRIVINTESLNTGIYFLILQTEKHIYIRKIIKRDF
ncbi:MAG: hypothetical protein COX07_03750 [Bacteroidetes bacterium CG23_combo_of_CG06-09_8_20_14_all_32_9]|nr:MAG: hypothetical protein COX07_03750 [Bacteroidetes bacterium CG23_combo_of_CG06-09_8_20_14_all_32_9]